MPVAQFLYEITKPFRGRLVFLLIASLWSAIDLSLRPYLLKCALDSVTLGERLSEQTLFLFYIMLYLGLMVSVFIMDIIYEYAVVKFFNQFKAYVVVKFFNQFKAYVGNFIFKGLIDQSYPFYHNHFAGSLGNRLNNCMGAVPRVIRSLNESFLRYSLAILIASYALWHVDFRCSLALVAWIGLYIGGCALFSPAVKKRSISAAEEASKGIGYIIDLLSNILSVILFSTKKVESQEVNKNFQTWRKRVDSSSLLLVNIYTFQTVTFLLFQAVCVYWLLSPGHPTPITAGDFVLFFSVSFSLYTCLLGFTRTVADYSENVGTISEALKVIYSPQEIQDIPRAKKLKVRKGQIFFKNVKFHYKGLTPLFQGLSIELKGGEKVGLVGYSGGGKTTFVSLILRLYDVTEGSIFLDEQDICKVSQESLRQSIAMIPQDPALFHRSLMENIRYGNLKATDEEVVTASQKAHAHEFISLLPQGYESLVGERGVKLSGGQRQRIAIARAILKSAPILILDEATSQLDSVTEQMIQESLLNLMENKTTIVIAHRLSTLLHMDRILVFDKGKVVEDGSHAELLKQGGLYKTLWEAQVGGFLPEKRRGAEK